MLVLASQSAFKCRFAWIWNKNQQVDDHRTIVGNQSSTSLQSWLTMVVGRSPFSRAEWFPTVPRAGANLSLTGRKTVANQSKTNFSKNCLSCVPRRFYLSEVVSWSAGYLCSRVNRIFCRKILHRTKDLHLFIIGFSLQKWYVDEGLTYGTVLTSYTASKLMEILNVSPFMQTGVCLLNNTLSGQFTSGKKWNILFRLIRVYFWLIQDGIYLIYTVKSLIFFGY